MNNVLLALVVGALGLIIVELSLIGSSLAEINGLMKAQCFIENSEHR